MLPRKPYSFICYRSTEDALRDVEEFNGYEIIPDQKRKFPVSLYLSFVTKGICCYFNLNIGIFYFSFHIFALITFE